mgnify:CR=1 FL=1
MRGSWGKPSTRSAMMFAMISSDAKNGGQIRCSEGGLHSFRYLDLSETGVFGSCLNTNERAISSRSVALGDRRLSVQVQQESEEAAFPRTCHILVSDDH